jgi:hypothetical protein
MNPSCVLNSRAARCHVLPLAERWTWGFVRAMRAALLLAAVAISPAWAQSADSLARSLGGTAERGQLLRLEKVWNDAHLHGDTDVLDRLWADELVVTVPGMKVMGKAEVLAVARGGQVRFQRYATSDLSVAVFKEVAVVTGRVLRTRRIGQLGMKDDWRFTKVYVRNGDDWQVVAWHASPSEPR